MSPEAPRDIDTLGALVMHALERAADVPTWGNAIAPPDQRLTASHVAPVASAEHAMQPHTTRS